MSARFFAAMLAAASLVCASAAAQVYPSRPITMIVPYPAGGVTDGLARMLVEHMRSSLRQPIIIENVSGGDGNIATGRAGRAPAGGYPPLRGNLETNVLDTTTATAPYDVETAFPPL